MKRWFLIISVIILLPVSLVSAAPAPWGLALNHETKECAGYWAGDEFTGYGLPEGWKAYYPTYYSGAGGGSRWGKIQTEIGDCSFEIRKEEACCMELGYRFVSDNIGKGQQDKLRDRSVPEDSTGNMKSRLGWLAGLLIIFAVAGLLFFFIYSLKRRKAKISERDRRKDPSGD